VLIKLEMYTKFVYYMKISKLEDWISKGRQYDII